MALEKQLIPIVFDKGINQDPDDKLLPLGELKTLDDAYWSKRGTIKTREGFETLTTNGTTGTARSLHNRKDELVQIAGVDQARVYAYSEAYSWWVEKNANYGRQVQIDSIVQNKHGQAYHDCAEANGYELYAWMDTRGTGIRYSVYDKNTNGFIVSDVAVDEDHNNVRPEHVRCCSAGNFLYLFYTTYEYRAPNNSSILQVRIIDTDNGPDFLQSAVELMTDINTDTFAFDVCNFDTSAVAYVASQSPTPNLEVGYVLTDGALGNGSNGYAAPVTLSDNFQTNSVQIVHNLSGDLYIVYYNRDSGISPSGIYYQIRNADLTQDTAETAIEEYTPPTGRKYFGRIACVWNEISGKLAVYYEVTCPDYTGNDENDAYPVSTKIKHKEIGAAGDPEDFLYHAQIAAYPFNYDEYTFLPVVYTGVYSWDSSDDWETAQATAFIVRDSGDVVAKYHIGKAGVEFRANSTLYLHQPPRSISHGYGVFSFPSMRKSSRGTIQRPRKYVSGITTVNNPYPHDGVGIVRVEIDMATNPIFISEEIQESLFLGSGPLAQYDGESIVENGFHVYPDRIFTIVDEMTAIVTQEGMPGLPEITEIECVQAGIIPSGSYINLRAPGSVSSDFVFAVNGVKQSGYDSGSTVVDLDPEDSAEEVATKLTALIDAFPNYSATSSGATVTVTNATNGTVTDASVEDVNEGNLSDGTRSYKAVYSWVDINGKTHVSAPSPATILELSGMTSDQKVGIAVPSLTLTGKVPTNTSVAVVVYRTEDLGTTYYRLPNYVATFYVSDREAINDEGAPYTYIIDRVSDADLIDNEILYTTGGIIENIGPPMANAMVFNKNRLFVAEKNSNVIWFSKKIEGEGGVEFSDLLTKEMSSYGGGITAFATMDEKTIIFKEKATFWMIGDGPNNLGQGSFSEPQFISKDIGCDEPLSIRNTPIGVIFKSNKGWYLLNRSLQLNFIGSQVEELNDLVITGSLIKEDTHQAFWSSSSDMLVYDYHYEQWSVWKNLEALGLGYYQGVMALLRDDEEVWHEPVGLVLVDDTADPNDERSTLVMKTGWFQVSALQGFQRVRRVDFLGLFPEDQNFNIRVYRDYNESSYDDIDYTVPSGSDIKRFQVNLPVQKCAAMMIEFRQEQTADDKAPCELTGMTLEIGAKKGTAKLAVARKT